MEYKFIAQDVKGRICDDLALDKLVKLLWHGCNLKFCVMFYQALSSYASSYCAVLLEQIRKRIGSLITGSTRSN